MSHFAKVENNRVTQVIRAQQDVIDSGLFGDPATWIQCSYNTRGNQHLEGGQPLRGNYPAIGFIYDPETDVFYAPQPYPSWQLNTNTWIWQAPEPYPTDNTQPYQWDESQLCWKSIIG